VRPAALDFSSPGISVNIRYLLCIFIEESGIPLSVGREYLTAYIGETNIPKEDLWQKLFEISITCEQIII
jgi:hypothetical protein